ncbi:MAG: hypothetical protein OXG60_04650 [Chloroflexi bacterium]|nr:hypothetical protein [Chloroflexota bacterium]
MAKYEYQGETFQVEATDTCKIEVSDGVNTVSITLNSGGPTLYKVSTVKGGWWWHHDTVEDSVIRACRELVKARADIDSDEACKSMSEYVAKLAENG